MVPTKSRNVRGRRMRARTQCPATCHACGQERGQVSRGVETTRGAAGPPFSWGSAAPSRAIACPPPRARQSILRLTGVCLCACAGSGRASPEQGLLARGEPALQPLRRGRGVPRTCTQAEAGPAERQRGLPCGPGSPRPWHRRLRRLRCVKRPRAPRPGVRTRARARPLTRACRVASCRNMLCPCCIFIHMTAAVYGCSYTRPVYLGSFADPRSYA